MTDIQTNEVTNAFSKDTFEHAQRVAIMLAKSSLIPKEFQGNVQNVMIALEMANRIGASPLMVMQNLYLVHGKPSWSSTFIISAVNQNPKFEGLEYELSGEGESMSCYCWAYRKGTKEKIVGPPVTMKMAKAEGWLDKNGSKWKTMPELMIRYRAATFFGRLYAPEVLMGFQTADEIQDIQYEPVNQDEQRKLKEAERVTLMIEQAKTVEELDSLAEFVGEGQMGLFMEKQKQLNGTV